MHLTFYFLIFFFNDWKININICGYSDFTDMLLHLYVIFDIFSKFPSIFFPRFFLWFFKDHSIGLNWTIYGILWIKVMIIKIYFPVVIIINWIKFRYDRNSATSSCHRYNYRENENSGEIIIWVYQI